MSSALPKSAPSCPSFLPTNRFDCRGIALLHWGPHTLAARARTLLRLDPALREAGEVTEAERSLAEGSNIWRELDLPAQAAL